LVDATLPLLGAAVSDSAALGEMLGVAVAEGWEGFPEALPVLRAEYEKDPQAHRWGALFFVDSTAGALVGFGGFKGPPSPASAVELGYAIAPAHRGRGLATDAVDQMVRRAFSDPLVLAVHAHTLGETSASTRVLEKSGFEKIVELTDPDEGPVWQWRLQRARE
jgi:RimJ/RimL family protein N-acetyltransferase